MIGILSTHINEKKNTHKKRNDLPATVGQTHGDGAEKQAAFGLANDSLAVGTWSDDYKFSKTIPASHSQIQFTSRKH